MMTIPNHPTGETVPWHYVQSEARARFLDTLNRLAPETVAELLDVGTIRTDGETPIAQVRERLARIAAWQRRHHLEANWITAAALETVRLARETPGTITGMVPGSMDAGDAADPASDPTVFRLLAPARNRNAAAVAIDGGEVGTFDPRAETIDDAVKRLLPDLEARLRADLARIAGDDRTRHDAGTPIKARKANQPSEWLVRYQVLGESRKGIAEADGIDRGHVTREVNNAARLIGLPLRKEIGGAPRKRGARTIRVR